MEMAIWITQSFLLAVLFAVLVTWGAPPSDTGESPPLREQWEDTVYFWRRIGDRVRRILRRFRGGRGR